jgi:putative ABC transport system permease protein
MTCEIIGVIGDVLRHGLDANPQPEIFVPHLQSPTPQMTFIVKTSIDSPFLLPTVKSAIRSVNVNQTFARTTTMDQLISDSLRPQQFNLFLLGSFSVLAMTLAATGVYGLISHTTKQRTREVGVRMALGASRRDILMLLLKQGLTPALLGIVLGLIASIALTNLMKDLLFGVSAADPFTLALMAIMIMVIAVIACYLPARKAARIDPMKALRYD